MYEELLTILFENRWDAHVQHLKIYVLCTCNEKVESIIKKYRAKSFDLNPQERFIFNAKNINPNITVEEIGLCNLSKIFVIESSLSCFANEVDLLIEELNIPKTIIETQNLKIEEIIRLKEELNKIKGIIKNKDIKINKIKNQLTNYQNSYNYEITRKNSMINLLQKKIEKKSIKKNKKQ